MIIQCDSCSRKFIVKDNDIPGEGRNVQCGYCSVIWHQMPMASSDQNLVLGPDENIENKEKKRKRPTKLTDNDLSIDAIKASDGKTYKFLGNQWAQLLPSGKTGLFAKKKIGKELDKVTGREIEKDSEAKNKKIKKKLDPSSEMLGKGERLPDIYNPSEGLGFFGYFLLIIVVSFSLIGILKTFETDLISNFPETGYWFEILNEQLIYIAETVKNLIVITKDLINSY